MSKLPFEVEELVELSPIIVLIEDQMLLAIFKYAVTCHEHDNKVVDLLWFRL